RLGLPPGIDDRAAALAHYAVVPEPGLGVDRLADRAEQAQRFPARALHRLLARADERADRRRRGVEDADLVLVDDLPEPGGVGVVGHALEHEGRGAVAERAVDDVAVPGHPADVGRAPVHVLVLAIEHELVRELYRDEIAARGVQHAFRLAR